MNYILNTGLQNGEESTKKEKKKKKKSKFRAALWN